MADWLADRPIDGRESRQAQSIAGRPATEHDDLRSKLATNVESLLAGPLLDQLQTKKWRVKKLFTSLLRGTLEADRIEIALG